MADIQLRDVRKSYTKDVRVIHGVTASIADGEFIVIVGPALLQALSVLAK